MKRAWLVMLVLLVGCSAPTKPRPLAIVLWPGDSGIEQIVDDAGYRTIIVPLPCDGDLDCWATHASTPSLFDAWEAALDHTIQQEGGTATVVGISRGGYLALRAGELDSVTAVVALSPVTDLGRLREFSGADIHPANRLNPAPYRRKPLSLTIGNNDTRVSTQAALLFVSGIGEAAALTVTVRPAPGHELFGVQEALAPVSVYRERGNAR